MTTTCRDTAAAGKNPESPMTPALPAGPLLVRGTILRIADLRVSIREHQSGGTPIHAVSTRRAHSARSPPAGPGKWADTTTVRCGKSSQSKVTLTSRSTSGDGPDGLWWCRVGVEAAVG